MMCGIGCEIERIEKMIRHSLWTSATSGIVVGVSGGIDSAVVAALSSRALGGEKVLALTLPAAVTPETDINDAKLLCKKFGITHRIVSIDPIVEAFRSMPGFESAPYLLGNIMARVRMTVIYYHANRCGYLVCGTSNRSEYMLGYSTKYGDNAADIQPVLHLYKTEVFELARELGIPETIIKKTPSAGLWPGQSDEGELGLSYADIDAALQALEEQGWKAKNEREVRVLDLVRKNMHKRMPPPHLLTASRESP